VVQSGRIAKPVSSCRAAVAAPGLYSGDLSRCGPDLRDRPGGAM